MTPRIIRIKTRLNKIYDKKTVGIRLDLYSTASNKNTEMTTKMIIGSQFLLRYLANLSKSVIKFRISAKLLILVYYERQVLHF